MPRFHRTASLIRESGWRLLLCLLCVCSASLALEIDENRLLRQAARYGERGEQAVRGWQQLIHTSRDLAEPDKLTRANDFWNRNVLSKEDIQIWNKTDYWATPLQTLGMGAGDCEDYVIGKYFSLVAMGVPPEKLQLIYVRARVGGAGSRESVAHMVLGYYSTPNAVPLVLDNLVGRILPATQRRDLTPVFSFNTSGVYVDGKASAPIERISRWSDLVSRMQSEGMRP